VLAIEARAGESLAADLGALTDASTARAIAAERAFLARLEGDCNVPLAAFAEPQGDGSLRLRGMVLSADGAQVAQVEARGADPAALGISVAEAVLAKGGAEILAELRRETVS
jgi:hydroxymethylbilane synthase